MAKPQGKSKSSSEKKGSKKQKNGSQKEKKHNIAKEVRQYKREQAEKRVMKMEKMDSPNEPAPLCRIPINCIETPVDATIDINVPVNEGAIKGFLLAVLTPVTVANQRDVGKVMALYTYLYKTCLRSYPVTGVYPRILLDVGAAMQPKKIGKYGFKFQWPTSGGWSTTAIPAPTKANDKINNFYKVTSGNNANDGQYNDFSSTPDTVTDEEAQEYLLEWSKPLGCVDVKTYHSGKNPYFKDPSAYSFAYYVDTANTSPKQVSYSNSGTALTTVDSTTVMNLEVPIKSPWLAALRLITPSTTSVSMMRRPRFNVQVNGTVGAVVYGYRVLGAAYAHNVVLKRVLMNHIIQRVVYLYEAAANTEATPNDMLLNITKRDFFYGIRNAVYAWFLPWAEATVCTNFSSSATIFLPTIGFGVVPDRTFTQLPLPDILSKTLESLEPVRRGKYLYVPVIQDCTFASVVFAETWLASGSGALTNNDPFSADTTLVPYLRSNVDQTVFSSLGKALSRFAGHHAIRAPQHNRESATNRVCCTLCLTTIDPTTATCTAISSARNEGGNLSSLWRYTDLPVYEGTTGWENYCSQNDERYDAELPGFSLYKDEIKAQMKSQVVLNGVLFANAGVKMQDTPAKQLHDNGREDHDKHPPTEENFQWYERNRVCPYEAQWTQYLNNYVLGRDLIFAGWSQEGVQMAFYSPAALFPQGIPNYDGVNGHRNYPPSVVSLKVIPREWWPNMPDFQALDHDPTHSYTSYKNVPSVPAPPPPAVKHMSQKERFTEALLGTKITKKDIENIQDLLDGKKQIVKNSFAYELISKLVPTYGNYGGPNWTAARRDVIDVEKVFDVAPMDEEDAYYALHDLQYSQAETLNERSQADKVLIERLDALAKEGKLSWYGYIARLYFKNAVSSRNNKSEL